MFDILIVSSTVILICVYLMTRKIKKLRYEEWVIKTALELTAYKIIPEDAVNFVRSNFRETDTLMEPKSAAEFIYRKLKRDERLWSWHFIDNKLPDDVEQYYNEIDPERVRIPKY